MQGLCFHDVQRVAVETLPEPTIQSPGDAIVGVDLAGLCGSDLHPFFGRETGLDPGTVMGHEFVGEVIAVGEAVQNFRVGDRVCAPFTTNCGNCFYCHQGLTSRCESGQLFGWRQNNVGLHGGQAQQVRVPLAEATLMHVPSGMDDETAILLGDNLSTGFFAADLAEVNDRGVYAVVGCGTVGLLAIVAAKSRSARTIVAVDPNEARLELARQLGAQAFRDPTAALESVRDLTDGRGADGVMELVGLPEAQATAMQLLRPGGILSVIGCHCSPHFAFSPADAYDKNLTYRSGRCPARAYMQALSSHLAAQTIDLSWCITHRFALDEAQRAYDVFSHGRDGCVKAVLEISA